MFKVNEIVVHKCDICKITEIKKDFRLGEDYYTLTPIEDSSLIINTPVSNTRGLLRKVISKKDAEAVIQRIPEIQTIEPCDDRAMENKYNSLINTGNHEDLIQIIKTTYLRNKDKTDNGKKLSEKDKRYFRQAEKIFYSELSIALNKTYDETKDYIANKMSSLDI